MAEPGGWRPTAALGRAVGVGAGLLLAAVLLRRADLVVLAAPLVLGAALALTDRPTGRPAVGLVVPGDAVLEGGQTTVTATVSAADTLDVAAVVLTVPPWLAPVAGHPPPAAVVTVPAGSTAADPVRAAQHPLGPAPRSGRRPCTRRPRTACSAGGPSPARSG